MSTPLFVLVVISMVFAALSIGYCWGRRASRQPEMDALAVQAAVSTARSLWEMDVSHEHAELRASVGNMRRELLRRDARDAAAGAIVADFVLGDDLLPCTLCGDDTDPDEWRREAGLCEACASDILSKQQHRDVLENPVGGPAGASISEQDAWFAGWRAGRAGRPQQGSAGIPYLRAVNLTAAWRLGHAAGAGAR